ncbi:Mannosyl-oligosaccharide alpha-1,2-mannosidase isoform B [Trichinella pseudospiralis]|uniref:alpha-1,2-Mannosidase n=1 Tax=Trichinella pseudospiralis TaxID=6337 RepID=A0A0V1EG65_TRIPS|nr:Mannosyl-oligosaccharide alpha-1,2-mannosidase isoform B [Trichinella pseudospiralis]KRZ23221.1 Mannosyl-oligosaccharide alpha-1,2-mannosidase isoform B [Trichinella pseudospiralis]KRZ35543.1 Mannosyl-oligosaccharide alpha-1,2-mannosidase isoform B [Trichinella pseudospiralis]
MRFCDRFIGRRRLLHVRNVWKPVLLVLCAVTIITCTFIVVNPYDTSLPFELNFQPEFWENFTEYEVRKNAPRLRFKPSRLVDVCMVVQGGDRPGQITLPYNKSLLLEEYNCYEFRRQKIVQMMIHAWDGYAKHSWGANELRPLTNKSHLGSVFGRSPLGLSIVDALDTLYIMGLMDRFDAGRQWVKDNLDFSKVHGTLSVFETTIRYIGGLLSVYALTNDTMFVTKAAEVADFLLPAFDTPTGIPEALVDISRGTSQNWPWAPDGASILSEFGTLQLEFEYLSIVTGKPIYLEKVSRIRDLLQHIVKPEKLYYNYLNPKSGEWGSRFVSVGALGDSFYEYLLKSWLISDKADLVAKQMYDEAMAAIIEHMLFVSKGGLTYFGELKSSYVNHKMDHLACFIGGLFALHGVNEEEAYDKYMPLAKQITTTCHESYVRSKTHLGPEGFSFKNPEKEAMALVGAESVYILRPEVVESYFYLWRTTKEPIYREWAWDFAVAIEKYCKTASGYSGIKNVYDVNPEKDDVQQSFFLAETLKYLYLIFSPDDVIPLDQWVFTSEAHPFPIRFNRTSNSAALNSQTQL